jgi:hypothetical protein
MSSPGPLILHTRPAPCTDDHQKVLARQYPHTTTWSRESAGATADGLRSYFYIPWMLPENDRRGNRERR